jgi:hypothetical protein
VIAVAEQALAHGDIEAGGGCCALRVCNPHGVVVRVRRGHGVIGGAPAAGFVREARAAGAHTVELNLEPSEGVTAFAEAVHGPATQVVPPYVDKLLAG